MTNGSSLHVEVVPDADLHRDTRQDLLDLCSRAYGEDFAPYLDLLSEAVHLLGYEAGRLVSHAAWVERELRVAGIGGLRTAYVEAVATLPRDQRKGHASALMRMIPALTADFSLAALSPSEDQFYRRLGWEMWQGPMSYRDPSGCEVPTPEERVMIYRLPRTPASLNLHAALSTDWRPLEVW